MIRQMTNVFNLLVQCKVSEHYLTVGKIYIFLKLLKKLILKKFASCCLHFCIIMIVTEMKNRIFRNIALSLKEKKEAKRAASKRKRNEACERSDVERRELTANMS